MPVADRVTAFAPGRVNLIGEHTDYNQGLALPFAISEGVTVQARAGSGGEVEAHAADLDEHDRFELAHPEPVDGWRGFVRGAVGELQRLGPTLPGVRLEISGSVPRGAGLSSSAALEVALCMALIALSGQESPGKLELAQLCSRIENEWIGARTGLLDQIASLCGQRDRAVRIDFRSLEVVPVVLELGGYSLVTLDSGEQHANAESGYNRRREECAEACAALGVQSLRDVTMEMTEALPSPLAERARHVVAENHRVEEAVEALEQRDLVRIGQLLDASHASLRDLYAVSTPAVESAVQRLKDAGAIGARVVGGGFGGHVLGLIAPDVPIPDGATEVRPGPGAHLLSAER
jgi:galactokinase